MKKISIVLVISMILVLLLSACGGNTEPTPDATDKAAVESEKPEPTENSDKTDDTEKAPEETEAVKETDTALDTTYVVEEVGDKDKNADGDVIGACHFQKLVFTNPNAALKKINEEIAEECDEFFSEGLGAQYKEYFSQLDDNAKKGLVDQPYSAIYDVENVFIDDKYVSIQYIWNWYAGGVSNFGGRGYTFDVKTGEEIDFEDLFASEADAAKAFSDAVTKLMNQNPEAFFEEAAETVRNYDMDDVKFSLDEKTITVYIDQYELAPGALGAFTVTIAR